MIKVRVHDRWPPGHIRTPAYIRGKVGCVERNLGPFNNPEQNAYRLDPDQHDLVRVRFTMDELWGTDAEHPTDTIEVEVYSHWLEKV